MASKTWSCLLAVSAIIVSASACVADEPSFQGNAFEAVSENARGRIGHAGWNRYGGEITAAREYLSDGHARTVIMASQVGRATDVPDDRPVIRALVVEINCNDRTTRAGEIVTLDLRGRMINRPVVLRRPGHDSFVHAPEDQILARLVCEHSEATDAPEFTSLRDFTEQVARSLPPLSPDARGPTVSVGRN
jgi:hypothetical protein